MKACAITDFGNMYGAISFYNTMKSAGIQPILGYEAYLTFDSRFEKNLSRQSRRKTLSINLVLLAKNLEGYHNLDLSGIESLYRRIIITNRGSIWNFWPKEAAD